MKQGPQICHGGGKRETLKDNLIENETAQAHLLLSINAAPRLC